VHRKFPQPFTNLYQDPIAPVNGWYSHKDHGRDLVRVFPSNQADQAGSNQYVVLYYDTCFVCELAPETFARKLLGESEIKDVLRRLDRLTLDEARMTVTETLQVIHGLVSNLRIVMGGTKPSLCRLLIAHGLLG
jgi:hypothetical protein